MSSEFDLDAFDKDVRRRLQEGHEAFKGQYKDELKELLGLSRKEIDAITPDTTDLQKYDELTTVVKEASRKNLTQDQLIQQIEKLGSVAISIAKHVPLLNSIFKGKN